MFNLTLFDGESRNTRLWGGNEPFRLKNDITIFPKNILWPSERFGNLEFILNKLTQKWFQPPKMISLWLLSPMVTYLTPSNRVKLSVLVHLLFEFYWFHVSFYCSEFVDFCQYPLSIFCQFIFVNLREHVVIARTLNCHIRLIIYIRVATINLLWFTKIYSIYKGWSLKFVLFSFFHSHFFQMKSLITCTKIIISFNIVDLEHNTAIACKIKHYFILMVSGTIVRN